MILSQLGQPEGIVRIEIRLRCLVAFNHLGMVHYPSSNRSEVYEGRGKMGKLMKSPQKVHRMKQVANTGIAANALEEVVGSA
jgi:hypothetical protein